ncbi:hypothetical protein EJF18_10087 [Clavispora lusitaniae]|uniref:Uncharacterized protein n=2 Tax=Clavispora lusitaniae TaxID=36911 RepID=A0AA91PVY2_CLALS|nr:hypothetical protein FOB63_000081 [Clavispora lusitaniae]OVF06624.1 hypothetical protein A9F13_19g00209 [Clavispora lusitaniae]QFZ25004.1 hypothetical protein EJF14_10087 [Clavispora lusitaniae]QFZ31693.1 hypothetical protein EJF16_10087 [Clavispora lusitaniae]QFZ37361.1 hypothetical protein EJF15_10087 [Clavispora lusitaniae]
MPNGQFQGPLSKLLETTFSASKIPEKSGTLDEVCIISSPVRGGRARPSTLSAASGVRSRRHCAPNFRPQVNATGALVVFPVRAWPVRPKLATFHLVDRREFARRR